jgi:hypothetical protein
MIHGPLPRDAFPHNLKLPDLCKNRTGWSSGKVQLKEDFKAVLISLLMDATPFGRFFSHQYFRIYSQSMTACD